MKVLVTGAKGQLGFDVLRELKQRGHRAVEADIDDMDITCSDSVKRVVLQTNPDAVIHCAAWTAVDLAEENEEQCRLVNAEGTANIVSACQRADCKLLYLSTDYVFDGKGELPHKPEDQRDPLNVYGYTKYLGELETEKLSKYYIVRISWVFGVNGSNFIKTMLKLGKTHERLTVVNDQFGSPTYTRDLARLLVDMIETDRYGIYHASNEGVCSWYEFACEIFRQAGLKTQVVPVSSDAYPTKAVRPHNSRMSKEKLTRQGFERLPEWQDALARYLTEIGENHGED